MLNITRVARTAAKPWFPHLRWWEWGSILGVAGIFSLMIFLAVGYIPHPIVVAVLLHIAADFTCQSAETSERKGERGRHLLLHALAAGGFPLAVASLVIGDPIITIAWAIAGVIGHYAVDWTRKFGVRPIGLGAVLDQLAHLAVILGVTLFS